MPDSERPDLERDAASAQGDDRQAHLIRAFSLSVIAHLDRLDGDDRFGIATSGGPDSMALLHLAMTVAPGRVEAATVDHGLRAGATEEAEMVGHWCADHAIPHVILRPPAPITGSIQAEARAVRYALLDGWMAERSLDWLLTAHHADDQLETMLMRLNRSSGVAGLSGIRSRRGAVLRPLLGVRKAELEAYVRDRHIPHAVDPSNGDMRFDRARMRRDLAQAPWLDPVAAAHSASALADAEDALNWTVDQLYRQHVQQRTEALVLTDVALPNEYLRRLLAKMLVMMAPDGPKPRGEQIEQAIVQLSCGNKISIGACLAMGGAEWTIWRAPPRRGA